MKTSRVALMLAALAVLLVSGRAATDVGWDRASAAELCIASVPFGQSYPGDFGVCYDERQRTRQLEFDWDAFAAQLTEQGIPSEAIPTPR